MIKLSSEWRYKFALSLMHGMGPKNLRILGETFEDISLPFRQPQVLDLHFPKMQTKLRRQFNSHTLLAAADHLLELCQQEGQQPLFLLDEDYPPSLAQCADAPIILYTLGNLNALASLCTLSIVGTRRASSYGLQQTARIVREIAELLPNSSIVSGLAYGIDIEAHRRSLQMGLPGIAVLAHGLDRTYPSIHQPEREQILSAGGILVSEYPPHTAPQPKQFVARNRIIAGLSAATLLMEAGLRSGSLSTARLALGYGREVFAIPGRLTDSESNGCLELLRRSEAQLLCSFSDVLESLTWLGQPAGHLEDRALLHIEGNELSTTYTTDSLAHQQATPPTSYDHPILQMLAQHGSMSLDELARELKLGTVELSDQLLDLELEGAIVSLPGASFRLA